MPETTTENSYQSTESKAGRTAPRTLRRPRLALRLAAAVLAAWAGGAAAQAPSGPLEVHPDNRRYLKSPNSDKAIYLAGSHHRGNLQDVGTCPSPPPFPFNSTYPASLTHNFIRGWHWEHAKWLRQPPAPGPAEECIEPLPFVREKNSEFDLDGTDAAYLDRLRNRAPPWSAASTTSATSSGKCPTRAIGTPWAGSSG